MVGRDSGSLAYAWAGPEMGASATVPGSGGYGWNEVGSGRRVACCGFGFGGGSLVPKLFVVFAAPLNSGIASDSPVRMRHTGWT